MNMTPFPSLNPTRARERWLLLGLTLAIVPGLIAQQEDEDDEEILELSPFEVDASGDQGYYSERTLAGSRIDTPLADIAASISIVNREQLEDTAATDINEVFLYEINTESADTYTPTVTSFRAGLRDANAGFSAANTGGLSSYATSNRIRGLASPDASRNYYRSIGQIGFDSYNTRSIEINRGPNSLLFGQGSPAGIVNQNTADAYTDVMQTEIQLRIGENGTFRAHANHNHPIIEDVLGVYLAALWDEEGFERQPSYDEDRRLYAAITYRPTDRINFKANYESYRNEQSRPNTLMPIDAVTPWLNAGRPAYDPATRTITMMDTGEVKGPYAFSQQSPFWAGGLIPANSSALTSETLSDGSSNPFYVPGVYFAGGRFITMIDDRNNYFSTDTNAGGVTLTGQVPAYRENPPAAAERTDAQWALTDRNWLHTDTYPSQRGDITNWQPPTLNASHRDIYDWENHNTNTPNNGTFDGDTYNAELDVKIADWWYVRAGYFNQTAESEEHFTLGQLNANRMFVDPNINLVDGSPNPFFGQPFVEDSQPDTFEHGWDTSTLRLQSAITIDFSGRDDIFRWLGKHNFIQVASRETFDQNSKRLRAMVASGPRAYLPNRDFTTPATNWRWWVRGGRVIRQYYMGSEGNPGEVTRSSSSFGQPSYGGPTETNVLHYNWNTESWENPELTWANYLSEATTFQRESTTDSITLAWNASLLDDRLVPTIGFRHDNIENRLADAGGLAREDFVSSTDPGVVQLDPIYSNWKPAQAEHGNTWTYGATFDVLRTDKHEVSVFYNESENFNPRDGVFVDFYGNRLGTPGGEGKDYGFSFGLWNNELTARVTWFENSNINDISGRGNAAIDRTARIDSQLMFGWAEMIARMELGQQAVFTDDEAATGVQTDPYELIDSLDPAITSRIEQITGLPYDYFETRGGNIAATENNTAEGIEIGVTWNPSPGWTFRGNLSKQETSFSEVAPEVDAWLEERLPIWLAATSPLTDNSLNEWAIPGGVGGEDRQVSLTNFWGAYGYNFFGQGGGIRLEDPNNNGWVSTQAYYEIVTEGLINSYKAQQGSPVDTQRKWRANFIGRYSFQEGILKGSFIGGGVRWEDKVAIGYLGIDSDGDGSLDTPDTGRPIWDDENFYFDVWAGYRTKVLDGRADLLVQLNIRNLTESGDLRPVGADFAGNLHTWRIVDPREIFLTTTLRF